MGERPRLGARRCQCRPRPDGGPLDHQSRATLGFSAHGRRAQRRFGVQQCQGREVDDGIAAVGMQFFFRLRKDAVGFGDALARWAFASCWWAGWE